MYTELKKAVDDHGEVMVLMDSGEEHELHKHNTAFRENGVIKVDAADTIHWFNADKVERYWIHKDF